MNKKLTVAVAVCLTVGTLVAAAAQPEETLVFILAGQSNMVGQGDTVELSEDLVTMPPNVVFYLDGEEAVFADRDRFGPEVTFAHEISRAYPERKIVLVKFAIGGSSLLAWAPDWSGEAAEVTQNQGQGPLYRTLMEHISASTSGLDEGARLAGVLWMQGERDARFVAAGERYGPNLGVFVERLRADLGVPNLPFLFGQVDPPADRYPAAEQVRRAQRVAEQLLPSSKMVSTEGLSKHGDGLHYDTEGQVELGLRFARAYLEQAGR